MESTAPDDSRDREDALLGAVEVLLRSNDDLSAFAVRVAHDLRSPLSAVIIQLQLADGLLGEEVPPRTLEAVRAAEVAAQRMRRTIEDVLAYATLSLTPRIESIDLLEVTRSVLGDLADQVESSSARVSPPASTQVRSDPTLIRLLLQNLIQNALVHAGPAPQVAVTAGSSETGWWLEVHDDGPGVPRALRERVFEPLVRGSDDHRSTGTGLATCARVAEGCGGSISVGDSPLGGAVFRVDAHPVSASG